MFFNRLPPLGPDFLFGRRAVSNPPKQEFLRKALERQEHTGSVSASAVLKSGLYWVKAVFIPSEAETSQASML